MGKKVGGPALQPPPRPAKTFYQMFLQFLFLE
jgi:hypothetical protein